MAAQALAPIVDHHFPEYVQLAAAGAHDTDFPAEKQIQLACKRAGWAARALYHRFDQAMIPGEPVHDEARISQAGEPHHNGQGRLHIRSIGRIAPECHNNPRPSG